MKNYMSERIIALFENFPPELATFLISMIPVVEVRGALPFAITQGVPIPLHCLLPSHRAYQFR